MGLIHRLGLEPARRGVILHADDVGMCHGANTAFVELSRIGALTCGSVMVPCPWFPEIAHIAAAETTLDLGVHLTLTSEWPSYRWGPLTRAGAGSGLVDDALLILAGLPAVRLQAARRETVGRLRSRPGRSYGKDEI